MAVNGQYSDGPFTGADYASTGAAGTPSAGASDPAVAPVTVQVTRPGGGFYDQVPVSVDADDVLVPSQAAAYAREPVSGVTGIDVTGAHNWGGNTLHPNSESRPR